jgi:hypothetical protein
MAGESDSVTILRRVDEQAGEYMRIPRPFYHLLLSGIIDMMGH